MVRFAPMSEPSNCPRCATPHLPSAKFCGHCGFALGAKKARGPRKTAVGIAAVSVDEAGKIVVAPMLPRGAFSSAPPPTADDLPKEPDRLSRPTPTPAVNAPAEQAPKRISIPSPGEVARRKTGAQPSAVKPVRAATSIRASDIRGLPKAPVFSSADDTIMDQNAADLLASAKAEEAAAAVEVAQARAAKAKADAAQAAADAKAAADKAAAELAEAKRAAEEAAAKQAAAEKAVAEEAAKAEQAAAKAEAEKAEAEKAAADAAAEQAEAEQAAAEQAAAEEAAAEAAAEQAAEQQAAEQQAAEQQAAEQHAEQHAAEQQAAEQQAAGARAGDSVEEQAHEASVIVDESMGADETVRDDEPNASAFEAASAMVADTTSGSFDVSDNTEAPTTEAPTDAQPADVANTMIGMPATDVKAAVARAKQEVAEAAGSATDTAADAAAESASEQVGAVEQAVAEAADAKNVPNTTMLGMAAPVAAITTAVANDAPAPATAGEPTPEAERSVPAVKTNRTMLGQAPPPAEAATAASTYSDEDVVYPSGGGRFVKTLIGLLLLGALIAGLIAAYKYFLQAPEIAAEIITTSQETLRLGIDVPDGTKVRFNGAEYAIADKQVDIPLAADALHLNENEFTIEIVKPNGSSQEATVVIELLHRVRPDLSALEGDEPKLRVVVDVVSGSRITLDGALVPIDSNGHGTYEYPVELDGTTAAVERTVHYEVTREGQAPAAGDIEIRVPIASLQLDRPGAEITTEADSIEIAGAAPADSTVTIDGNAITLNEGRFLHRFPMPSHQEYAPVLLVRQEGRVPRQMTLKITRVRNLAEVAAQYEVDDLTYARIAQNPSIYRGRKVEFKGRVYNVDVHQGRSILQILVEGCAEGQRCPLWITYAAATEHEVNDWVRVRGEVAGEQQFRSGSGQLNTVPRVDAAFLLEYTRPTPRRRRRRRR